MSHAFLLRFVWIGVILLSSLIGASSSRADDTVPYRHYTVQDGLPHESIRALAQGPSGRLWIGTQSGLAVYDGHEFRRPVGLPDSLRSATVTNVQVTPSGTTWGAFEGVGIVGLRGGTVTEMLPWPEGANGVERILMRRDTLLVVTTRALWLRPPGADSVQNQPYDYPIRTGQLTAVESPTGRGVRDADLAPDGTPWVVDAKRGPGRVSLDGSVTFADSSYMLGTAESWRGVRFTRSGEAFLVGTRGIRLDPRTGRASEVLTRSFVNAAVHGNTLYGVRQGRVVRWTAKGTTIFGREQGLPQTLYRAVLRDEVGGLWIGTEDGLLHLPTPNARHTSRIDNVNLQWMTSLDVDPARNELWASSWGKGLFRVHPRPAHTKPVGEGRWTLSVDVHEGKLHALGEAGWIRRGATGWRIVDGTVAATSGIVRQNRVGYFQSSDALLRVRPEQRRGSAFRGSRAPSDTVWHWPREDRAFHSFTVTPAGNVLLRRYGTLLRISPDVPRQVDTVAAFPRYADVGGGKMFLVNEKVYLGLNRHGVLRIDPDESSPVADLVVPTPGLERLTASGDSLLFVSSTEGLYAFDPQSGQIRRHLTMVDGLAHQTANAARLYRDTLYVCHENGLSRLPQAVLGEKPTPPTTLLTGWNVEGARRSPVDSARLATHERTVSFDFTGVHLSRGPKVRYAYRLRPRDTTWATTRQAFTRYTDLGPGTYRFEARAYLEDGPVGPTAQMTFTVPKAYYETTWFKGLVILGILGLVGAAYAWRIRTLRRREETLRRMVNERTEQLAEEKRKTERQAERLEALDAEKNRFFANVSHELRTPLTILLGSIQDLLDEAFGQIPVAVREQLEIVRSNAERMHRLTDQLLDLAHLETAEPMLDPEPRDLVALLRRATRRVVPMAERRGLRLDLETEMDAHPCRVDPEKMEKIAGNLVSNALKHTPEGGTVTVRLAVEEGTPPETVLHVTDTGPGIPPDQQDEIFERFARAENGASAEDGTGLGLALAREYAELHDGSIEVASTPGAGSTFTVRLPLPPADPDAVEPVDAPADAAVGDSVSGQSVPTPAGDGVPEGGSDRPVLLVVEDNDDVRAYLRRHLADAYEVVEAVDGTDGLDTAREVEPDLILSDVMMPEMGGIELCRRVRDDDTLAHVPVVLLTARAAEDDAVAGLEAGADAYVTKPFSVDALKARLARLLEAHWAGTPGAGPAQKPAPDVEATAAAEAFLDRVTDAIDEHRSRTSFTVEDLAAEVGLSRRQLHRRLKRLTGTTPAAFIRRYRLDAAAQLLEAEAGTVSEIAYEVGFGTPKTFARRFKERFGCSPSEYPDATSDPGAGPAPL
jgi:signal transduction histidine kinase/DNA-binding response OmpR family regulator